MEAIHVYDQVCKITQGNNFRGSRLQIGQIKDTGYDGLTNSSWLIWSRPSIGLRANYGLLNWP